MSGQAEVKEFNGKFYVAVEEYQKSQDECKGAHGKALKYQDGEKTATLKHLECLKELHMWSKGEHHSQKTTKELVGVLETQIKMDAEIKEQHKKSEDIYKDIIMMLNKIIDSKKDIIHAHIRRIKKWYDNGQKGPLPTFVKEHFDELDKMRIHEMNKICAICISPLGKEEGKFYCINHKFHDKCYASLIENRTRDCPICRGEPNEETKKLLEANQGGRRKKRTRKKKRRKRRTKKKRKRI
jgi:hypothetical protein